MAAPLATPDDVAAALLRPLTDLENTYIESLLDQASAMLRNAAPSVDQRIIEFQSDSTNTAGIDPLVVTAVVAGMLKRYLNNPNGLASTTETVGPYSVSRSFALRTDKDTRGALELTDADLKMLYPNRKRPRVGSIRIHPSLAPRPVGQYGQIPSIDQALSTVVEWNKAPWLIPEEWMSYTPNAPTAAQVQAIKSQTTTNVVSKSVNYTASGGDEVLVTTGTSTITVTLPTPANGILVVVKKIDAGSGSVTVAPATVGQTIDGQASFTIPTQFQSIDFVSDGTNWFVN